MPLDINFELYKVFYYVAKTLSFSQASKELFISQSAVSQSVKVLEKHLNQPLFIRSTKKVGLTREGELLFKHIEPAVNLIIRGQTQIMEAHYLNGGQLRIGASDTICRYFLVPYFENFHKKHPNIHIKVTNDTSLGCVDLLENNQVDLIITNFPNHRLNSIPNVKELKDFSDVFVAGRDFFPLLNHPISLAELKEYPILMLDKNSATGEFLNHLFLQYQLDLAPAVELSSNDLLIDFAKIGLGIAFVPDFCISSSASQLVIIKTVEELPQRKLVAAYSGRVPLSKAAEYFLESLCDSDKEERIDYHL